MCMQVVQLQSTLSCMQRERDSEFGRTGDFSAHLTQQLQQKEAEIQQLSHEISCCREEATCMQRAHESACQQVQNLTGELDHIAAVSVSRLRMFLHTSIACRCGWVGGRLLEICVNRRCCCSAPVPYIAPLAVFGRQQQAV
jgi:hypothetical protein